MLRDLIIYLRHLLTFPTTNHSRSRKALTPLGHRPLGVTGYFVHRQPPSQILLTSSRAEELGFVGCGLVCPAPWSHLLAQDSLTDQMKIGVSGVC